MNQVLAIALTLAVDDARPLARDPLPRYCKGFSSNELSDFK